jgi:molybdate-binding protein
LLGVTGARIAVDAEDALPEARARIRRRDLYGRALRQHECRVDIVQRSLANALNEGEERHRIGRGNARLANALDVKVEDLFCLKQEIPPAPSRTETVTLLAGPDAIRAGQAVQLCRVDKRMVASAPDPAAWYLPVADAMMLDSAVRRKGPAAKVRLFHDEEEPENRILVAGCDPGIPVLARHARRAGLDLVVAHRNSSQALALLKRGLIHVAGTHLRDDESGEWNLPAIRRIFPDDSVAVVSFAIWEDGLVVARGNPKSMKGAEDLGRRDVLIVNREAGAGSRMLLDAQLSRHGLKPNRIRGYDRVARGHLAAAWHVATGQADCCIATQAAARVFGLDFVPLESERYDFVIRKPHITAPAVQVLLETLTRSGFRRELAGVGGYDMNIAGHRQL